MVRKIVAYIFIPFLAFLLMSHNAFAVELTPAVRYKTGYMMPYWSDNHNRAYATGGYNYLTNGDYENADILYFKSSNNTNISVAAGNYVSLTGDIVITVNSNSQAVSIQANPRQYFVIGTSNVDCPLLSFDETSFQQGTTNSNNVWTLRYTFSSICRLRSSVSQNVAMNISLRAPSASGTDTLRFIPTYMAIWEPVEGYDDSAVIEAIDNLNTTIQGLIDATEDIADAISDAQENEEQATQDAADQAQQDADSSSSDASQGTASLISSIGSAVSVISSASPTNCKINGNMGNLNMGQIDLCANPVPSFVQIITSLLLILITVPLCITLFNRFIALFRSFQG